MTKASFGSDEWYDGFIDAAETALRLGPLSAVELAWGLVEDGWLEDDDTYEPDEALLDLLSGIDGFWVTADETVADDAVLLNGIQLTRRLTAEEVERGSLLLGPDLELQVFTLAGKSVPWAEGGELERRFEDTPSGGFEEWLDGPEGWLGNVGVGDLIALVRKRQGLAFMPVEDTDDEVNRRAAAVITEAFESRVPPGQGQELPVVLMDALVFDEDLFRAPTLPVSELLAMAGLEQDGELVGRVGEDWEREDRRQIRERLEDVLDRYDYEECCVAALRGAVMAWALTLDDGSPALAGKSNEVLAHLGHGDVAEAFVDVALGRRSTGDERLDRFAEVLGERGDRRAAPAAYVRARNAERDADTLIAEHLAGEAHGADPEYGPAAAMLGWFALDRGDLARAKRLLSGSGVDLAAIDFVDDVAEAVTGVGRNEPCPCGSGRKFRACCQGRVGVAPHRRAALVYNRLWAFAVNEPYLSTTAGLTMVALTSAGDVERVVGSGFVHDLAFFEAEVAAAYLDRRGVLLADEDRMILEAAISAPRQLWEVVASEPGTSVTLRDTGTNDVVTIAERRGSHSRRVGEYVIGRVVPVSDELQLIGAVITVDMRHRDAVLALIDGEAGAYEWADWYGRAMAPPD